MKIEGARVTVVGMARSGRAAVEFLKQKGALVRAVDETPDAITGLDIAVEPQREASFEAADLIVLSPGVKTTLNCFESARARGVPIIGDLELASWFLPGKIIGITGSNGKTTTTLLTGHVLASCGIPVQVGGNLGVPPVAMIASGHPDQWNVLELSSFQLEKTRSFRPDIGAALNVTQDHLDHHGTIENYAGAKGRMFVNQTESDTAVLNGDDEFCRSYAGLGRGHVAWFSSTARLERGACLDGGSLRLEGVPFMKASEVPLRGLHNLENAMAAALIASRAGAEADGIRKAVMSFPGVEHRLEFVREIGGVAWYNDSKATNVDATLKAIAAFENNLWVILGGKDKESDYRPLADPLRRKAQGALLIGAAAGKIESHLEGSVPLIQCGTIGAAVAEAHRRAAAGDTVLLAPSCASFDQFENFEHRGREFKRLVQALVPVREAERKA